MEDAAGDAVDAVEGFYPDKARLIATVDAKAGKLTGLQINGVAYGWAGVTPTAA